jgi:hypothetical protein
MGPGDVTAEWLSGLLGGEIGGVESERIGDGLVGLNLRVRLVDAAPDLPGSVVLKLPSLDETSRATGIALRNYEREVKFYTQLASTVDIRVPHCFHGEWDETSGDFVLVLEDMAPAEQGDQIAGCSTAEAEAAVDELAKLHGPSWDDPTLLDIDWLGRSKGEQDAGELAGLWQLMYPGFEATYSKYLSDEALELVREFANALGSWADRPQPWALTHGDFRLDNLLFGTAAGGPPVTAVDWQTPAHGPPIADLSYFCGAGLVPEVRRQYEQDLVERYIDGIRHYGVEIHHDSVWEQFRREAFAGVIMAVIASQVVGESERSEAMFATMATRHLQHALDLDSLTLI